MHNDKLRISEQAAEMMKSLALPVGAQKLLLALMFAQEQTEWGWVGADWGAHVGMPFFRSLNDLRALGCAPRSGNARLFETAVEVLSGRPALFDWIELSPGAGRVTWAFGARVWEAMAQSDRYGLMQAHEIAHIHRRWDLELLAQIVVQRGKRTPEFVLFRPNEGYACGPACDASLLDLRKERPRLEAALATWSQRIGASFIVGYEQRPHAPGGYIQARVRFTSPKSSWTARTFRKFPPNTKIVSIPHQGGAAAASGLNLALNG